MSCLIFCFLCKNTTTDTRTSHLARPVLYTKPPPPKKSHLNQSMCHQTLQSLFHNAKYLVFPECSQTTSIPPWVCAPSHRLPASRLSWRNAGGHLVHVVPTSPPSQFNGYHPYPSCNVPMLDLIPKRNHLKLYSQTSPPLIKTQTWPFTSLKWITMI